MESVELVYVCIAALIGVFAVLTVLAAVMKAITSAFPQHAATSDAAMIAAVNSVVTMLYPKTRVTKIEEVE